MLNVKNAGSWVTPTDLYVKNAGVWTPVQEAYIRNAGVWTSVYQSEASVSIATRSTSVDVSTLFDATTWTSAKRKRVVIPASVVVNANDWRGAIFVPSTATAWGGGLIIDVSGSLYGIGGVALSNSGEGGAGIGSAIAGASGQYMTVNRFTGSIVYAGGGAGGRGGTGGNGSYVYNSYDSGFVYDSGMRTHFWKTNSGGDMWLRWNNEYVLIQRGSLTQWTTGSTTYYRGSQMYYEADEWGGWVRLYQIKRVDTATGYTSGGVGGYGGRGQGSDGAAATGSSGTAGGTNAGTGGTGGTGAARGAQGSTGSTGSSGNAGSGVVGNVGGLGGKWLWGYCSTGTSAGATAGRLVLTGPA